MLCRGACHDGLAGYTFSDTQHQIQCWPPFAGDQMRASVSSVSGCVKAIIRRSGGYRGTGAAHHELEAAIKNRRTRRWRLVD